MQDVDVVVIGAGAAGLMCAASAAYRGRSVLVLDHANKAGKKILMSGGGRCNFTNLNSTPANFLSDNPAFCISALKRYTPHHFLELVERHGVEWCEKAPGQLFCNDSSKEILRVLLTECEWAGAEVRLNTSIKDVRLSADQYLLRTASGNVRCQSLVVACGGLSIPTMGATGLGYQLAEQFGLTVLPRSAGLVPFTLQPKEKEHLAPLSGVAVDVAVSITAGSGASDRRYREPMLITHRGLSGPSMLQISSFWRPGDVLSIDLLPDQQDLLATLKQLRRDKPTTLLARYLAAALTKRFADSLCEWRDWSQPLQHYSNEQLEEIVMQLKAWQIKPSGTEGYRTAEVTLGGVDTRQLSSKTMMANDVAGLYFIGEAVDVTGELGGHNFQWAWASGWCAGQFV
ncbi:MAG: NAD(P)/FAD-dependent oxidoreductase [Gammaproteobacteria bacterium]|nr:NAD(P)/FAD-dependent oxidoreductase [Gammaproteobacteria bacterium]MBQ0773722.1 NAD(P)/FAD-dependent oxidoreductase [Gammaproteobacteria bacterium]